MLKAYKAQIIILQSLNPTTNQIKMKFLLIVLLLSGAMAMPRLFNKKISTKTIPSFSKTLGVRGAGMTVSSIRMYMRQQKHRAAAATKSRRSRIDNILNGYFQRRDSH